MTEAVLDASVVLKWFAPKGERHAKQARQLRSDYEGGSLIVLCPGLLHLEVINVAARSWGWEESSLVELASALVELSFETRDPSLAGVAQWAAEGLTAYDAAYVALAEEERVILVTDDDKISLLGGSIVQPLASV